MVARDGGEEVMGVVAVKREREAVECLRKRDGEVECCFGRMMMEKKSCVYANGELGQVAKRSSVCGFDEDGFVGCDE